MRIDQVRLAETGRRGGTLRDRCRIERHTRSRALLAALAVALATACSRRRGWCAEYAFQAGEVVRRAASEAELLVTGLWSLLHPEGARSSHLDL